MTPTTLWQGECFVFDTRVAVDRDRAEGDYVQCHACRLPLSSEDLESPDYREGVSCPRCFGTHDEARVERLEERRKQVALAKRAGRRTHRRVAGLGVGRNVIQVSSRLASP